MGKKISLFRTYENDYCQIFLLYWNKQCRAETLLLNSEFCSTHHKLEFSVTEERKRLKCFGGCSRDLFTMMAVMEGILGRLNTSFSAVFMQLFLVLLQRQVMKTSNNDLELERLSWGNVKQRNLRIRSRSMPLYHTSYNNTYISIDSQFIKMCRTRLRFTTLNPTGLKLQSFFLQ